jgi:excisionase family DNA binding protein
MRANKSRAQETAVYSSVPALAKELGIVLNAVYEGLKNGSIPSIRVSKKYIIPRSAIQEWLRTAGGKVA